MHRFRLEVAQILERFLNGTGGPRDWDDFTSRTIDDPELNQIRRHCNGLSAAFPPERPGQFCGALGAEVIRNYIRQLRQPLGRQTTVTDPKEVEIIDSQLHGWWFSLETIVRNARSVSIPLWRAKTGCGWFGGLVSSAIMPAVAWAVIHIDEVASVEIADAAGIDSHELDGLRFDVASRTLTLTSSFPLAFRLVVEKLAVTLEREAEI